jgi:hypothetical protein
VERATAKAEAEAWARAEAEAKLAQLAAGSAAGNTETIETQEPAGPRSSEGPETGCCECCNASGTPVAQLKRIDSGQWLCPHCLAALQSDAARVQSDALPERAQ